MGSMTAYATTSTNPISADPGVSVFDGDTGEEVARENVDLSLDAEDGELDTEAADRLLKGLGFRRCEPWCRSGGQWGADVEPV